MRAEILAGKRVEVGREVILVLVTVSSDLRNLSDGKGCLEARSSCTTYLIKDSLVPGASKPYSHIRMGDRSRS